MDHDYSLSASAGSGGDSVQTFPGLGSKQDQVKISDAIDPISTIGFPIVFAAGQFTGSTIRMELNELQKADLGRK
jgi:hypothetical protein